MKFISKHPIWPSNYFEAPDAASAANRMQEEFMKHTEASHVTFYHPNKQEYIQKTMQRLRQEYLDTLEMVAPYPAGVMQHTWECIKRSKNPAQCEAILKVEVPELTKTQRQRLADCLPAITDPEMLYYALGAKETGYTEKQFTNVVSNPKAKARS